MSRKDQGRCILRSFEILNDNQIRACLERIHRIEQLAGALEIAVGHVHYYGDTLNGRTHAGW